MNYSKKLFLLCTICSILLGMGGPVNAQKPVTVIGKYLCINYKPFFPIGLYSFPDRRNDDSMWKEAADAGFNFALSGQSGKYGIYVARAIPWKKVDGLNVSLMELYRDESLLGELKSFLANYENDSTVICWHAPDEPEWFGPSANSLQLGYEAIKANSRKPVWLNTGQGPAFLQMWHYNSPKALTKTLDILSEDIYPIPDGKVKYGQSQNEYAYYVGQDTKRNVDLCSIDGAQTNPVWMVLQGFGWADMGRNNENPPTYVPPTKHELRFMAYDAIVHGATGLIWYGVRSTKTEVNARLWSDLKELASELRDLYSVWTCPFELVSEKLSIGSNLPDNTVHCLIKLLGNKVYVLAVNTRDVPLEKVTISVAQEKGVLTKVNVMTENRQLPVVDKNSWTDRFEGYGVHIYETDIYFSSFMNRYYKDPTIANPEPAKK